MPPVAGVVWPFAGALVRAICAEAVVALMTTRAADKHVRVVNRIMSSLSPFESWCATLAPMTIDAGCVRFRTGAT
jgi:hypothetical protein